MNEEEVNKKEERKCFYNYCVSIVNLVHSKKETENNFTFVALCRQINKCALNGKWYVECGHNTIFNNEQTDNTADRHSVSDSARGNIVDMLMSPKEINCTLAGAYHALNSLSIITGSFRLHTAITTRQFIFVVDDWLDLHVLTYSPPHLFCWATWHWPWDKVNRTTVQAIKAANLNIEIFQEELQ